MKRRGFFAAIVGAGGAAVAAPPVTNTETLALKLALSDEAQGEIKAISGYLSELTKWQKAAEERANQSITVNVTVNAGTIEAEKIADAVAKAIPRK